MGKCDCYHTEEQIIYWAPDEAPVTRKVGSCWGTKEREQCICGGDRVKCDFYLEIREKAKTVETLEKQVPKKPRKEKHFMIHHPYFSILYRCPNCNHLVEEYEDGWGTYSELRNNYCSKCGQALDWDDINT